MTTEEKLLPAFGLKDFFTCINLMGGILAIIFSFHGHLDWAAYSFLLGYILGDALDGYVARLTQTGNRFGSEFDVISDHVAQCVAPAVIVYMSYLDISPILAGTLASMLIIAGSIRHARGATVATNFPGAYMGLPRTISSFLVISYMSSGLLIHAPGGRWVGVVMVVVVTIANLVPLPFRTHRSGQKLYEKIGALAFFITTLLALVFLRAYTFDVVFIWILIYTLFSWMALEPHELRAFFARARVWSREVRQAQ